MERAECVFESEVLAAVVQSRWPERVDPALRAHVAACEICADVAAIAGAMEECREETLVEVAVPDSGRVWWLAQMRARREAAKTAGRPITAVQVLTFACAMGLIGACFGATSTWFQSALRGMGASAGFQDAVAVVAQHGALAVGMVALVLLVPAVVYLAIGRE